MQTRWYELPYTKEEENKQQHKENTCPWGRPEAGLLKQRLWKSVLKCSIPKRMSWGELGKRDFYI